MGWSKFRDLLAWRKKAEPVTAMEFLGAMLAFYLWGVFSIGGMEMIRAEFVDDLSGMVTFGFIFAGPIFFIVFGVPFLPYKRMIVGRKFPFLKRGYAFVSLLALLISSIAISWDILTTLFWVLTIQLVPLGAVLIFAAFNKQLDSPACSGDREAPETPLG